MSVESVVGVEGDCGPDGNACDFVCIARVVDAGSPCGEEAGTSVPEGTVVEQGAVEAERDPTGRDIGYTTSPDDCTTGTKGYLDDGDEMLAAVATLGSSEWTRVGMGGDWELSVEGDCMVVETGIAYPLVVDGSNPDP